MNLASYYDRLNVEHRWLAHTPVNCLTGLPEPGQKPITSHCSCFVFAALQGLKIPLLGPPAHSPVLLANAQNHWLKTVGPTMGWRPIPANAATRTANAGEVVVASLARKHAPGHIALVRPQPDEHAIRLVSAGLRNYQDAALGTVFSTPDRVEFFAHPL